MFKNKSKQTKPKTNQKQTKNTQQMKNIPTIEIHLPGWRKFLKQRSKTSFKEGSDRSSTHTQKTNQTNKKAQPKPSWFVSEAKFVQN